MYTGDSWPARPTVVGMTPARRDPAHARRRGYWLRLARNRAGLTLKQVAVEMGYALRSQTTIRLWEEGERDPSDVQLSKIAKVYKVPVDIFIRPRETDGDRLDVWVREALRQGYDLETGEQHEPPAKTG